MTKVTRSINVTRQGDENAPTPETGVSLEAIDAEIRIVQSVQAQGNMPVLIAGNACAVTVVLMVNPAMTIASNAVYLLAAELFLLLPMVRSYWRLRNLPRPTRVSGRRIFFLEFYSLVLGIVWALAIVMQASHLKQTEGLVVSLAVFSLCFGAVSQMSSLPKAAVGYFTPVLLSSIGTMFFYEYMSPWLLALVCLGGIGSLTRSVLQNWHEIKTTTTLSLGKLQAEAEIHRRENRAMKDYEKKLETQVITRTKALKESEGLLKSIIENIPVGLLVKDRNHIVVLVNNTYLEWYGLKSDSLLGKPAGKIKGEGFRSDHEVAVLTHQEREVLTTGRIHMRQVERTFADSKIHTVSITKFPIFDQAGMPVGVGSSSVDMTEQVEIRQKLSVALEEVKSTQSEIIQASKLATLGEMATSVAHELNQPLNIIRMAAGNSRRRMSKGTADPEYVDDKLERIEQQTARAAAIIDHMRMFGREAKEAPEPIDLRNVVTNALSLVGEQLRLAGIDIVTELAQDCPSVIGHTIQMEQVVLNLLTNAKDAMAERDGEAKITLRIFADDKGVHLISEDTGGGIPDDVLPRIFEPFYTTKAIGKGTGLGLSVSYGIVRDMNGTIIAENVDDGARFTITLPSVS